MQHIGVLGAHDNPRGGPSQVGWSRRRYPTGRSGLQAAMNLRYPGRSGIHAAILLAAIAVPQCDSSLFTRRHALRVRCGISNRNGIRR